jgi:hypothetical protein
MGFFDIFKASDSKNTATRSDPIDTTQQSLDPLISVPVNIIGGRLEDMSSIKGNKYALADALYNSDERLYSSIELMAIMITKSIGDVSITGIRQDDDKMTSEEENAVKIANKFAKDIGVKELFYRYTIDLWKYGDAVDLIKLNSKGIVDLEPLPMQHVTAVEKREQLNSDILYGQKMIQDPKWYVLNEGFGELDLKNQIFKKERILHISFNPKRNLIRDNKGRWTYGVWSNAPINSLIAILQWKQNLIRNDMLWSNRSVPREHHKLDLSQFTLDKFPGTFEQKQAAAITAAQKAIQTYNDNMKRKEADQGYVSGMSVDIGYVEPKTTNWQDPSGKLDQINQLIGGPTGTPSALMGGESKGFTSVIHSSSFLAMRAEIYATVIQKKLEELIKRHVGIVRPGIRKKTVDRLYIKNRLILDRDRAELAKIIAVLAPTNVLTTNDLRRVWGLDPLTDEEMKQIERFNQMKARSSTIRYEGNQSRRDALGNVQEDLTRKKSDSPTGGQESNQKRNNDRFQIGDDRGRKQV